MRRLTLAALVVLGAGSFAVRARVSAADAAPTFTRDVAPILYAKCVACHRAGEVAPMPLLTYQDARPFARAIRDKVAARQMPPWFADRSIGAFANGPSLTDAEIATISRWFEAGAPQGDAAAMPKPPQFTEGWQLGEPDQIIELPEVQIPAEGKDYFPTPSITLDLKEDRWIRAIEIRPSNREVTHHSVIFATNAGGILGGASGFFDVLGVWAVGTPPTVYPEGMGRWIRKGQTLRTNLHYHPNGTPQVDRTRVGLYFGKGELKKEVVAALAGNLTFTIPPNAPNHELRAVYVIDQDVTALSFFPHMHLRGKDMTMSATFPDGRRETLLNVPAYDFNWQLFYYPKQRVALPRGTRIDLVAHYDNSTANRHNPDPTKAVRFGEASTAEMMFGLFEFTADAGVSPKPATDRSRMDALMMTMPRESTYLLEVPWGPQPTPIVLSLPRSGEAATIYVPLLGLVMPQAVDEVKWDGHSFECHSTFQMPPPQFGNYTIAGTVDDTGRVTGTFKRRGTGQPPVYEFTGTRKQ